MSLSLHIHPLSPTLDMYGEPDTSSAYSLSGHITLTLSSPFSLFESRRTARLLLQSVSITFEGQSELFTPSTGYSAVRLCSITQELTPQAIELSNEGHEVEPCVWNIIFNIPIPGWLPASVTLGMEDVGVRYGLYVKAKFASLEEDPPTWSFASLCSPFRSRVKCIEASKGIKLRRFCSTSPTEMPFLNYLVNAVPSVSPKGKAGLRIPLRVLSKVQVLASVPQHANIKDTQLPVTIRLRTKGLPEEDCQKLQVTDVAVDIIQHEKCRHEPSAGYTHRFPIPGRDMQPPNLPLRDPHSVSTIYDVGLYLSTDYEEATSRSFSLLPSPEAGKQALARPNYAFANDVSEAANAAPTWYTMETSVPFVQQSATTDNSEILDWAGPAIARPSMFTPLYTVQHEVAVALACSYDLPNGDVGKEKLMFRVPVAFGRQAPKPSTSPASPQCPSPSNNLPNLPVYSDLYDSSGERKIDYETPLPLYSPRPNEPEPSALPASTIATNASSGLQSSTTTPESPPSFTNTYRDAPSDDTKPSPLLVPGVEPATS